MPALKIDNDRPVGCPFPPGLIVDASHANNGWIDLGPGAPLHMSQDRGITQRHAKAAHQSFCGAAASAMPEKPNDAGQTRSSASEWRGALIHSRCNLWEKGEPNLLKLLGVQTFSVASSMTLYSAAPPDRILTRSPQVMACRGRDLAPKLNQSLINCHLTTDS